MFSEITSLDKNQQKLSEWCSKGKNVYYAYCKFVILRSDVIMLEKHKLYRTVQRKNTLRLQNTF